MPLFFNWIHLLLLLIALNVANGQYIMAKLENMSQDLKDKIHEDSKWWMRMDKLKEPIKVCPIYDDKMAVVLDFHVPADKIVTNGQIVLRYAVYNGWETHPFVVVTDGQHARFHHASKTEFSISTQSSHYFEIRQSGVIEHINKDTNANIKSKIYGQFILDQAVVEDEEDTECLPMEIYWEGFPSECTISFDLGMLALPMNVTAEDEKNAFKYWIVLVPSFLGAGVVLTVAQLVLYLCRLRVRAKNDSTKTDKSTTKTK